jgi:predicted ATPase
MTDRRAGAPEYRPDSRPSYKTAIVGAAHSGRASRSTGYRMISSVDIENFRPFKKLTLSNLERINIVVGDNSSGKTAFLEAIFLASAANPQLPINLRLWRGLEATVATTTTEIYDALWSNLFNEFDKNRTISIQLHGSENDSRTLFMHFQKEAAVTLPLKQNGGATGELKPAAGIYQPFVFHWKVPNEPDMVLTMKLGAAGLQMEGITRESNLRSAFIPAHAQTSQQYTASLFSNLSKENKEGDFINALVKQFPHIQKVSVEIEAGAPSLFVSVPWVARKMPLALFSNAASNLATILLNIAASTKGIVCLDEIENGFHYTRQASIWEQLYQFANDYQTQVFATTHSLECLKAAVPMMQKHQDDFSVIQLHQSDGISNAFTVPANEAIQAIENDIELRGP